MKLVFFALSLTLFACGDANSSDDAGTPDASDAAISDAADAGSSLDATAADADATSPADAGPSTTAAAPSTACSGGGLYLAQSAATLTCGTPLSTQLVKPYVQIRLAGTTPATYAIAADCSQSATAAEATYDDAQGTHDAVSGTITLTAVTSSTVSGSYDLDVGTAHLTKTFEFPVCP